MCVFSLNTEKTLNICHGTSVKHFSPKILEEKQSLKKVLQLESAQNTKNINNSNKKQKQKSLRSQLQKTSKTCQLKVLDCFKVLKVECAQKLTKTRVVVWCCGEA